MKKLSIILGSIVSLAVVIGILFNLDSRWTKATVTKALDTELRGEIQLAKRWMNRHELQSRWNFLDKRVWTVTERYRGRQIPQTVREELRRLKAEMNRIEKKLKR